MPDAKNNAKLTGDTHPPELEDAKGSPQGREEVEGAGGDAGNDAGGKKTDQAGYGKDKDAPGLGHGKA